MSGRDARPPRSQRPRTSQSQHDQAGDPNAYAQYAAPDLAYPSRPPAQPVPSAFSGSSQTKVGVAGPGGMVSFQNKERGERSEAVEHPHRPPRMPSAYTHGAAGADANLESGYGAGGANVGRKKSLVKPDREKIEPGHRQWHYRTHAAQMENENRAGVMPSSAYFHLA
jgi:chitin synthase